MNSPIGGKSLKKFGSPGRMDTDQVQAPLHRDNNRNLSSHDIPPRGGHLEIVFQGRGMHSPIGGKPWKHFGCRGQDNSTPPLLVACARGEGTPNLHKEWVYGRTFQHICYD